MKNTVSQMMSNVKTRTLVIFVGVIVLVGLGIAITSMKKEKIIAEDVAPSRVGAINKDIKYVPGGKATESYYQTQYQENEQRAQQASTKGLSTVPTIVADQMVSSSQIASLDQQKQQQKAQDQAYQDQLLMQQQQQAMQRQSEQQAQASQQNDQRQQAYEALMTKQAQTLFAAWAAPKANYVAGSAEAHQGTGTGGGTGGGAGGDTTGGGAAVAPVIYKAGDILYAVMETSVNTDEPGPIMAKIVSNGPLKNARVIGSVAVVGEYAKKAMLQFTVLNTPALAHSVGMNAVAIDPDTARTALATDVDNHYLLRYGTLFASSFAEGMSQAVLSSLNNPGFEVGSNGVITGSSVGPSTRDQLITGLGQVGQNLSNSMDYFNRPATITIAPGTSMGLLLMQDLTLDVNNKPTAPPTFQATTNNRARGSAAAGYQNPNSIYPNNPKNGSLSAFNTPTNSTAAAPTAVPGQ